MLCSPPIISYLRLCVSTSFPWRKTGLATAISESVSLRADAAARLPRTEGPDVNGFAAEVRARLGEQFGDERSWRRRGVGFGVTLTASATPKPIEIALYDELTKGAVTAAGLGRARAQAKAPPAQDATEPVAATG
jgi:hypothetical protein